MSAIREEFHHLVDELPEAQVRHALAIARRTIHRRQAQPNAMATVDEFRNSMRDVTGIDDELQSLRDNPRG